MEGILNHYPITLHPWDGGLPFVSLVGSRPLSCYLIQNRQQQPVQTSSLDGAGSKVPWHEEIGQSSPALTYPSHLLAMPSFVCFFFFNLDVVDIMSEILLLALQVCLSAKTLPPGSSSHPRPPKCKLGRVTQKVIPDRCH